MPLTCSIQMSSAVSLPVSQLLQLKDDEFDSTIKDMGQRNLMDTITGLQKEMGREQENFNSMSEELKGFKDRNSRQYKQISKDLMASQTRLTSLMNKSMKCFAQQNFQQGKDGVILRRRNSAKGTNPNSPTKHVQRSQSMYIPQDQLPPNHNPAHPEPVTLHTSSTQNINRIPIVNSNFSNVRNSPSSFSSKSASNFIRVTNPNKPVTVSHNFSPVSSPGTPLAQSTSSQNSGQRNNVSVNLKPDDLKTSINIASKSAVITSSSSNISNEQSKSQNFSKNNEEDFQSLPNVRRLAQSFGSSKQPNAPPRPNRANIIMNRNLSISNQNLTSFQKVNGVQSSLQNGDLGSQQRKAIPQSVNIGTSKTRPVSVVNTRDITPQRQLVANNGQKSQSVQDLTSDNDNVKTTLTVSFGNKAGQNTKPATNNHSENKNIENRHSWFGQKGDSVNKSESNISIQSRVRKDENTNNQAQSQPIENTVKLKTVVSKGKSS